MAFHPISPKVIEKWRKEDIELHKRVITSYLHQCGYKVTTKRKFFLLYDKIINPGNIRCYLHKPVELFVKALVLDKLHRIADIFPPEVFTKRKRTKRKRTKSTK